jgi:hypothetical protein
MFLHTLEDDDDDDEEKTEEEKSEGDDENKNEPEEKLYGPVSSFILGLFFEGDQFQYARNWVVRTRMVLQCFIVLVEILYLLFVGVVLLSVFFPLPKMLYDMLINVFKIGDWYLYPVFSIIFLQEICNVFNTAKPEEEEEEKKEEEKKVAADNKLEARLRKVLSELKKRFDAVGRKITKLEGDAERLQAEMAHIDPTDFEALVRKQGEIDATSEELEARETEWLELAEQLGEV